MIDFVESLRPTAAESHGLFGAGFLFLGGLLVVEALAGSVWHRSRIRVLIWPAAVFALGVGMLVVTYVEPTQKFIHLLLAVLLLGGGLLEACFRLRRVPRSTADIVVVPALILGGLLIGPLHAHGSMVSDPAAQRHVFIGLTGLALGGVRVAQSLRPTSLPLAASFGSLVMALALALISSGGHAH